MGCPKIKRSLSFLKHNNNIKTRDVEENKIYFELLIMIKISAFFKKQKTKVKLKYLGC